MDGLQRLLAFTDYLRSQRMPFLIGQERSDAVTLSFGTFGNRFSLDFQENRVDCRRYGGSEAFRSDLNAVIAMIAAQEAVPRPLPGGTRDIADDGGAPHPGAIRRLLDFTACLRKSGIAHAIEQHSPEALEVSFTLRGKRVEVEFSASGTLYSEFEAQAAGAFEEAALRREVEVFTRPFHPAPRMRREREHAAQ